MSTFDLGPYWAYPQVQKVWGKEYWLQNNDLYCGKLLELYPGYQCSLHCHPQKRETFIVLSGTPQIQVGLEGPWEVKAPGDSVHLPAGTPHRFAAAKGGAVILEISSHHDDTDVIRYEESQEYLPF